MDALELKKHIVEAIRVCETKLPDDVKNALKKVYENEERQLPKMILGILLENVEVAEREHRPICQDTGTLTFYVKRGNWGEEELLKIIHDAVKEASEVIPLRPNTIDFTSGINAGNNTGRFIPWVIWEPGGENLEITVIAKGGGSEAVSSLKVLPATAGHNEIFRTVLESVAKAGAKPCPPIVLGVGIAPSPDIAFDLAKRAIYLRPLGIRHENKYIAQMEENLLKAINMLEVGVHGFGGITALDVHIEYASIHPSSMAVGVIASCWALRRATLKVHGNSAIITSICFPNIFK
ncbi:MAG: fumarate hydratase [Crenarchaeota archaeon]|nr:fumarate hydratase [Thermoproteota archaeon]MDW8034610.1 fumarate hydratase [Nitrososphaerota archaeon]